MKTGNTQLKNQFKVLGHRLQGQLRLRNGNFLQRFLQQCISDLKQENRLVTTLRNENIGSEKIAWVKIKFAESSNILET